MNLFSHREFFFQCTAIVLIRTMEDGQILDRPKKFFQRSVPRLLLRRVAPPSRFLYRQFFKDVAFLTRSILYRSKAVGVCEFLDEEDDRCERDQYRRDCFHESAVYDVE